MVTGRSAAMDRVSLSPSSDRHPMRCPRQASPTAPPTKKKKKEDDKHKDKKDKKDKTDKNATEESKEKDKKEKDKKHTYPERAGPRAVNLPDRKAKEEPKEKDKKEKNKEQNDPERAQPGAAKPPDERPLNVEGVLRTQMDYEVGSTSHRHHLLCHNRQVDDIVRLRKLCGQKVADRLDVLGPMLSKIPLALSDEECNCGIDGILSCDECQRLVCERCEPQTCAYDCCSFCKDCCLEDPSLMPRCHYCETLVYISEGAISCNECSKAADAANGGNR